MVTEAGLTRDGWIPVDALTFETSFPGVYALGDVTFFGDRRSGELIGPSAALAADKAVFGSSRIKRWFGRDW